MSDSRTLAEIAEASGLPARTIRFYIARGLLSGPSKSGRGAAYTAEHLAQLDRIKELQAKGHTLAEIAHRMGAVSEPPAASPPTAWWQHEIAGDVIVWIKAGAPPWRMKQVRAAIDEFARHIAPPENDTGKG